MSLNTGRLVGKVCVVTGAARSVGFDIAKRYAEYGAMVCLLDINPEVIESAEAIRKMGFKAEGFVVDVTDHDAVISLFNGIVEKYGPIFALVNSAGIAHVGTFESGTPELWKKILNVNVIGTVNCIQGAIPSMKAQREGKVINFSSKAGKQGSKLMTIYGASKGAIITLTQALAQEYASSGLNINCLCPDIISETGVWDNVVSENYSREYNMSKADVTKMYEAKVPLGRFVHKEDITDMVCFYTISGDDCTGQSINITGGRTMH